MSEQEKATVNEFEEMLRTGAAKAEDYLKNPDGLEALLQKLEANLSTIPHIGKSVASLPLMISMVRAYITQEYTEVSPKVVGSLVGLVLYLLKKKDLIPDDIPILGKLDDIAAIALVLYFTEPELRAYSKWREEKGLAKVTPVEPDVVPEPAAPAEPEVPAEEPEETAE